MQDNEWIEDHPILVAPHSAFLSLTPFTPFTPWTTTVESGRDGVTLSIPFSFQLFGTVFILTDPFCCFFSHFFVGLVQR